MAALARSAIPFLADVEATLVIARSGQAQGLPLRGGREGWGCKERS